MSTLIQGTEANSGRADQKATIDLQEQSVQLQKQVLEPQETNYKLKFENHELIEKTDSQKNIKFNTKVYFCYGEANPFCPNCFKKQSLLIRLAGPRQIENGHIYNCPVCKKEY